MFDHIGLRVASLAVSMAFYRQTLAPLDLELVSSGDDYAGFGPRGAPRLWLHAVAGIQGRGVHLAFSANSAEAVNAFHAAGLAAGARDNGAPGLRPDYGANYYGAFLIDGDGNNIEAVCHLPQGA
jgi:catechol 2,3-dioxygenase-like lactoylglutathione lyase family enzyme